MIPNYTNNAVAKLIRDNTQQYLWNDETVDPGTLSVAFQVERINRSFYPWGLSFEVVFSGDPGTFEIDIMGANNDNESNYLQIGTITFVNSTFVGRWDMPTNVWPKYVAGLLVSLTNDVNITLQVTR